MNYLPLFQRWYRLSIIFLTVFVFLALLGIAIAALVLTSSLSPLNYFPTLFQDNGTARDKSSAANIQQHDCFLDNLVWQKHGDKTRCYQLVDLAQLRRQVGRGPLPRGNNGVVVRQLGLVDIGLTQLVTRI